MFSIDQDANGGDAIGGHSYLFDDSTDLLPLASGGVGPDFSLKGETMDGPPFGGFDHLDLYEHYHESGPSSVQFGEFNEISDRGGSHMSGKEEADVCPSTLSACGTHGEATGVLSLSHDSELHSRRPSENSSLRGDHEKANAQSQNEPESLKVILKIQQHSLTTDQLKPRNTDPPLSGHDDYLRKGSPERAIGTSPIQFVNTTAIEAAHAISTYTHQSSGKRLKTEARPKSSIPSSIRQLEFARQCILAAYSSRLNPFTLHPGEYNLLGRHITRSQVTLYLNIRNAILRLWTRNPLVSVTREEALGCARESRFFNLADVAYQWLLRQGYINFGCVEATPYTSGSAKRTRETQGKRGTIVIIGAGISGLSCARQLEHLCSELEDSCAAKGRRPPRIIVLEGRNRIGGRVYSHPLRSKSATTLTDGMRSTAEMGAQIVTGFEHGNPLNIIIRGQLALRCHALKDNSILYDYNGEVVDKGRDVMVERLYNDILERASVYRTKPRPACTIEGDQKLIEAGRDPSTDSGPTISLLEGTGAVGGPLDRGIETLVDNADDHILPTIDKLAGRAYFLGGSNPKVPAAEAARSIGWQLKPDVSPQQSLDLTPITEASEYPTLGRTMDEAIRQYQNLIELTPRDMRLLNWHHANLEYANATNVNQLSLGGWDQDIGNEFEGEHCEVVGGYMQVPRGLWQCPRQLDVRFNSVVKSVDCGKPENSTRLARVVCENGDTFEADQVVISAPLGVLKEGTVSFKPPLPDWKRDCIERLGFGVLNKVVLVYEKAFWEQGRDMFGLLNEADVPGSLNQKDYESERGRFYLFWNCTHTSGRPVLIALMAGDAARQTEEQSSESLVQDVSARLGKVFAPAQVPEPSEVIITKWRKDPFARGSYSYMGPETRLGDYELMAQPVGRLHFAGEATCGTHPATVHGAYLSGLRAASEVIESLVGPIQLLQPLVPPKVKQEVTTDAPNKRKLDESGRIGTEVESREADQAHEAAIIDAILAEIGERPTKPGRSTANPFLMFQKDYWSTCKAQCDEARQKSSGASDAKASRNEIRATLGQMWRKAAPDVKQPYLKRAQSTKEVTKATMSDFKKSEASWDVEAARIRKDYMERNPLQRESESRLAVGSATEQGSRRRSRRQSD